MSETLSNGTSPSENHLSGSTVLCGGNSGEKIVWDFLVLQVALVANLGCYTRPCFLLRRHLTNVTSFVCTYECLIVRVNFLRQILKERGVKENLRFDPKLKAKGLLDLFMKKPDTSVPK